MRSFRTLIPLSVILVLGAGVACKKPAPAPEPVKPVEAVAPTPAAENNTAERDAADAARRKAEAEAEAARKAAAEAEKAAAFKRAAEAALLDINYDYDKSDIREMDKAKLQAIADFLKAYPDVKLQLAGRAPRPRRAELPGRPGRRRSAPDHHKLRQGEAEGPGARRGKLADQPQLPVQHAVAVTFG
jgi:type IV secretory pathway VirB10-like protein